MHVEEALHGAALLGLLDLELREQIDEPLEAPLVAVDPEKVHFPQIQHGRAQVVGPLVVAFRARVASHPVPGRRTEKSS